MSQAHQRKAGRENFGIFIVLMANHLFVFLLLLLSNLYACLTYKRTSTRWGHNQRKTLINILPNWCFRFYWIYTKLEKLWKSSGIEPIDQKLCLTFGGKFSFAYDLVTFLRPTNNSGNKIKCENCGNLSKSTKIKFHKVESWQFVFGNFIESEENFV